MQVTPTLSQVRAAPIVDNRTRNTEIEVVMPSTLDDVTWSNPVVLSEARVSAHGPDITRGVRFGVRIRQVAGTAVEMARISLIPEV